MPIDELLIRDAHHGSRVAAITSLARGLALAGSLPIGPAPSPIRVPSGSRGVRATVQPVPEIAARAWQRLREQAIEVIRPESLAVSMTDADMACRRSAVRALLGFLSYSAVLATDTGPTSENAHTLVRFACAAEAPAAAVRRALTGEQAGAPPDAVLTFADMEADPGFATVVEAAQLYLDVRRDTALRPVGRIDAALPGHVVVGDEVTVIGTDFGDQGLILVDTQQGWSILRTVDWSPEVIRFAAPPGVTSGPVAVYPELPATAPPQVGDALAQLLAALGAWTGVDPLAAAGSLSAAIGVPALAVADGPMLSAGAPVISTFTVDGAASVAARPGQRVMLRWQVHAADEVSLVPFGGAPATSPSGLDDTGAGHTEITLPGGRWAGGYTLTAANRGGRVNRSVDLRVDHRVAFALGGGGARGDFQLGALRYLDERGITPDALATTSVGSINGLQLAHGAGAQQRLEQIWLQDFDDGSTFFARSTLVEIVRTLIDRHFPGGLTAFADSVRSSAVTGGLWGFGAGLLTCGLFGPFGIITGLLTGIAGGLADKWQDLEEALNDLEPVLRLCVTDGPPISLPGTGFDVGRSGLFSLDPIRGRIDAVLDADRVATSGIDLRMVAVSLDEARVVAVDERRRVWVGSGPDGRLTLTSQTSSLTDAAIASSSMPSLMEHQPIGSFTCVDGGIREVVPVRVAVEELGASTVYAITCSAPVAARPKADEMCMLSVFGRSMMEVVFDEIVRDDAGPYGGWPDGVTVHVIAPTVNLHDSFVIEPALVRIAVDYGWMRAADVLAAPSLDRARSMAQCDLLVRARVAAWKFERLAYGVGFLDPDRDPFSHLLDLGFVNGYTSPADRLGAAGAARAAKRDVRDACRARIGLGAELPNGFDTWYRQWEHHGRPGVRWNPPDPTPWGLLNLGLPGALLAPEPAPTL